MGVDCFIGVRRAWDSSDGSLTLCETWIRRNSRFDSVSSGDLLSNATAGSDLFRKRLWSQRTTIRRRYVKRESGKCQHLLRWILRWTRCTQKLCRGVLLLLRSETNLDYGSSSHLAMSNIPVTLAAIQRARARISGIAYKTPLYFSPRLSDLTGAQVYLKLESFQPIRVFKIRGASNKILNLSFAERRRGFVTASSGNHGLAVSYVAKRLATTATIVVPITAVEEKVRAIEEYGAKVEKYGRFHDERMSRAIEIQRTTGAVFVHPFDDPDIIAGQGTIGLEIIEDLPDVNTVFVPIGGGGLISGISIAIKSLRPTAKVIGVEPERASSMYQSIKTGKPTRLTDTTSIADGLATREPGTYTFEIARKNVDDILLVNEAQIERAVFTAMKDCHIVVEPSAGAVFAALTDVYHPKGGEKIVLVVSGGNISLRVLGTILSKFS